MNSSRTVPVLLSHIAFPGQRLRKVDWIRGAMVAGDPDVRAFVAHRLPRLVAKHIATADTVGAALLTGGAFAAITQNLLSPRQSRKTRRVT